MVYVKQRILAVILAGRVYYDIIDRPAHYSDIVRGMESTDLHGIVQRQRWDGCAVEPNKNIQRDAHVIQLNTDALGVQLSRLVDIGIRGSGVFPRRELH